MYSIYCMSIYIKQTVALKRWWCSIIIHPHTQLSILSALLIHRTSHRWIPSYVCQVHIGVNWEESYTNIKFINARCRSNRFILDMLLVVQLVRKFPVSYKAMFTRASRFSFWCIFRLRFQVSLQWKHTPMETGQAEYELCGSSYLVYHYSPICSSISSSVFITCSCSLYSVRFI
jgi:hypothetical protein